ncbi:LacI family transcriptional regulator [Litoreibacter ponti]|uniref:LacI family transcriptional regulator n=1 Tax=Litoreibacter ponti TaxID=1510457 RepID=A0A2T6BHJ2_9RHOB|nr:LacI family DNA-binding transcriptional regulator [Litoreibacter ponti]PTX55531.1 LacI family transcriptional regulator [Litoreibacter ponti]
MAPKVTALDVARAAGVSQPTVSRVFTPGMKVSATLADKVKRAAAELGYRPNTLARSLITGQSKTIGLIVAYLDNPFYTEALEKLSRGLREKGYHIMVFMAANHASDVDSVVHDLLAHQVDGIILASVAMSSTLTDRLSEEGVAMVLFNRGSSDRELSSVTSANFDGGKRVAELLIAGGHARIAHISGWQGASTGRDRAAGFEAGLAEAGYEAFGVVDGLFSREAAMAAARALFAGSEGPDAIFVGNDHMAFAVMDVVRGELGLRIPEDVSIVGYDDVAMAAWPTFELTTVRQPANRMVDAVIAQLMAQIEGDAPPKQTEIEGPLVIRRSARIPEGWST